MDSIGYGEKGLGLVSHSVVLCGEKVCSVCVFVVVLGERNRNLFLFSEERREREREREFQRIQKQLIKLLESTYIPYTYIQQQLQPSPTTYCDGCCGANCALTRALNVAESSVTTGAYSTSSTTLIFSGVLKLMG